MPVLLGPNAGSAGLWTAILAPGFSMAIISSPVSMTASITENVVIQLRLDVIRSVMTVVVFAVPAFFSANVDLVVALYGALLVVTYFAYLYFHRRCAKDAAIRPDASIGG
jgi:ABC-type microcin C transport system permease subunit YejB